MIVVVPPASAARLADSKLSSVTNSPSGTATWQCGSTPPGITSSPVASSTSAPARSAGSAAGSSTPVIRPPATVTVAAPLQVSVTTVPPRITRSGRAVVTSASDVGRAPVAAQGARRGDGSPDPVVVGARAEQESEQHPGLVRVERARPGSGRPPPARSPSRRTRRRWRSAPRRRRCARPAPPGSGPPARRAGRSASRARARRRCPPRPARALCATAGSHQPSSSSAIVTSGGRTTGASGGSSVR